MNIRKTNTQNLEIGIAEVMHETGVSRMKAICAMLASTARILIKRPSRKMVNALEILEALRLSEIENEARARLTLSAKIS